MADITKLEVLEMHKKDLELIDSLNKLVKNQESRITILKEMVNMQNEKTTMCTEAISELLKIVSELCNDVDKINNKKKK